MNDKSSFNVPSYKQYQELKQRGEIMFNDTEGIVVASGTDPIRSYSSFCGWSNGKYETRR